MTEEEATKKKIYGENGAFLMVDKVNKIATVPTKALSDKGLPMGINYSTEMIYNQFTPGRRNFCMICGEFLPRIGFTEVGERITTNAVAWDDSVYSQEDSKEFYAAVKEDLAEGQVIYACVVEGSKGKLTIGAKPVNALGNVYAQVVKAYTNADGTERMSKGVCFDEEAADELVRVLVDTGHGNTRELIDVLRNRNDFEESYNNSINNIDDLGGESENFVDIRSEMMG